LSLADLPRGRVRAGELSRVLLAFLSFFLLLSSYYMLRPVRDEMGVETGVDWLQWLFSGTFVFTLLAVPVFGWVVKRVPRQWLLPTVYGFVVVNLLGFYASFSTGITAVTAAGFFIWLSVFNLIVVSLFWSNVSDAFTTEQSHRLYGYIAAGGTAGALAGPALTALLARYVSSAELLALSALLLASAAGCMVLLRHSHRVEPPPPVEARPIGGSVLAGIPLTLKLPSLRGVALLVICYTAVHTVLYVEIADLARRTYADPGERTAFFASLDLAVNGLALAVQLLLTRPIVQRFGLAIALVSAPLLVLAGLVAAGVWRTAILVAGTQIVNRAGEFSLVRPGREMIYTTVDPESRYKAKNFIDTVVYRGNDAVMAWLIATIRSAGLDAVVLAGVPLAIAYIVTSFRVGRRHDRDEG
jgi:AAA family ATP:ADP antiporter